MTTAALLLVPASAAALGGVIYRAVRLRDSGGQASPSSDAEMTTWHAAQGLAEPVSEVAPRTGYQMFRTLVDPFVAMVLLVLCAPLFAVIWSAIRLSSPGPALFRQKRIGKGGKPFTVLKFRTMRMEAPTYSLKVTDHDPTVTTVGRFLRRSGLDELPQLWNVVRGDMAIIGPRPEQVELIDLYEPWQRQRHLVKPGITGWWQIHHRDGVPLHLNVDKDLYYIQHQGPWLDCLIVVGTCEIVLVAVSDVFGGRQRRVRQATSIEGESAQPAQASPLWSRPNLFESMLPERIGIDVADELGG